MRYLCQVYNSVYDYWEADAIFDTAAEAWSWMLEYMDCGFVKVRYRKVT